MLAQLNPNRRGGEASWEAYWLPVARPGTPHVLEIDYPSDVPQTVGVSIVEPNAAGAVTAVNVDSGFDVTQPPAAESGPPRWLRHRIVFWPRSKLPIVLVSNRSQRGPAVYGKIRVLAGWEQLLQRLRKFHCGALFPGNIALAAFRSPTKSPFAYLIQSPPVSPICPPIYRFIYRFQSKGCSPLDESFLRLRLPHCSLIPHPVDGLDKAIALVKPLCFRRIAWCSFALIAASREKCLRRRDSADGA